MKQLNMFAKEQDEEAKKKYSSKVEAPIYEPKVKPRHVFECFDKSKTIKLIADIESSSVSDEEKIMLKEAAERHTIFNYETVADYYAHATPEMQSLMEDSALVIIDFDRAIELGYVQISQDLTAQYGEEYPDA